MKSFHVPLALVLTTLASTSRAQESMPNEPEASKPQAEQESLAERAATLDELLEHVSEDPLVLNEEQRCMHRRRLERFRLTQRISEYRSRLDALLMDYDDKDPLVNEYREEIADIEDALARLEADPSSCIQPGR